MIIYLHHICHLEDLRPTPLFTVLEVVDSNKYLGFTVTEDLCTKHITETAGKASRSLGFLRRNFKNCLVKATYTTVVRRVLEYASPVWDPHRRADMRSLEQVQHHATRYVNNDYAKRTCSVTDMIKGLGWENLEV